MGKSLILALAVAPASALMGTKTLNTARPARATRTTMSMQTPYSGEYAAELQETANAMVGEGKGLLACDESTGTVGARLESIGLENTEQNRQIWRNLLFTTPGINQSTAARDIFFLRYFAARPRGGARSGAPPRRVPGGGSRRRRGARRGYSEGTSRGAAAGLDVDIPKG